MLCAHKAYFTEWATYGIIQLIRACGGHGFSHFSGLPVMLFQQFPDMILEGEVLMSESKMKDCCKKLEDLLFEEISKNFDPVEAMQAKKKRRRKQMEESVELPFSKEEALKILTDKGVIEYIVDDDVRDTFFDQLMPMLVSRYQELQEELQKQLSSQTSNVVNDLTIQIKHIITALQFINKSIMKLVDEEVDFDENQIEEVAISLSMVLADMIAYLTARKFNIALDKSLLRPLNVKGKNP